MYVCMYVYIYIYIYIAAELSVLPKGCACRGVQQETLLLIVKQRILMMIVILVFIVTIVIIVVLLLIIIIIIIMLIIITIVIIMIMIMKPLGETNEQATPPCIRQVVLDKWFPLVTPNKCLDLASLGVRISNALQAIPPTNWSRAACGRSRCSRRSPGPCCCGRG